MRRLPIALLILALSAATVSGRPALAAEPSTVGNTLDLAIVGVPIEWRGRLVNYVLVRLRIVVRPGTDVSHLSEKEPYFREALVRLGYHMALNPPNSLNKVDPALVHAKMLPLCQAIAAPDVVTDVQIKYQEPQKRLEAPAAAPASAPRPNS
jgi:hypothetical protein